jgi:hypothetical protein
MAKIDITKTELVWLGKYNDDGTRKEVLLVSFSFQVIKRMVGGAAILAALPTVQARCLHHQDLFNREPL